MCQPRVKGLIGHMTCKFSVWLSDSDVIASRHCRAFLLWMTRCRYDEVSLASSNHWSVSHFRGSKEVSKNRIINCRSYHVLCVAQWTENGVSGVSGRNVVPRVAEEYNDVIEPAHTHSSAAMVAMATRRRSRSAT